MKIELYGHMITDCIGIKLYDIYKISTVKSGKNQGKRTEYIEAYGVTLSRCFEIILDNTVAEELGESKSTMEQFLQKYEEISQSLKKEVQRLEASLKNK